MGYFKYLGLLFNHAAAKSVTLTDRLTILIVPFTTLVLWTTGAKMTETIQETLALGVAITVMGVVVLRFASASYFLWKEDRAEIASLKADLKSPQFQEAEVMNDHRLQLRKELRDRIAWLTTFAEARAQVKDSHVIYNDADQLFAKNFSRADEIITQLSYDVALRVTCLNLVKLAADIAQTGVIERGEKGNPPALDRLRQQRKLTFSLLHRQDMHEIITLAQIESLIEEHGENFGSGIRDLKNLIRDHPELAYHKRIRSTLSE